MTNLLTFLKDKELLTEFFPLINKSLKLYQLVDPITSSVTVPILQLILDFFADAENTIKTQTQDDAIQKLRELFKEFSDEIDSIEKDVEKIKKDIEELKPQICLIFDTQKWQFDNSKGISSIADLSANTIQINFIKILNEYNKFFAHCNLSGAVCDIKESHIILELPENYSFKNIPIRIYLQKIFID